MDSLLEEINFFSVEANVGAVFELSSGSVTYELCWSTSGCGFSSSDVLESTEKKEAKRDTSQSIVRLDWFRVILVPYLQGSWLF